MTAARPGGRAAGRRAPRPPGDRLLCVMAGGRGHPLPRPGRGVHAAASAAPAGIHPAPRLPGGVAAALSQRPSPLESGWLAAACFAAAVAAVAVWAWRARRRRAVGLPARRGRLATAAAALLTVTPLLLGCGILVNSYVGYAPTVGSLLGSRAVTAHAAVPDPGRGPAGRRVATDRAVVERVTLPADRELQVPALPAIVYLPPGYGAPGRRYPVVYLIHGHPGRAVDWFNGGRVTRAMDVLLADRMVQPMIVVAPTAAAGWAQDSECLDATRGPKFDTYLTRDVVGFVDATYDTVASAGGRAIGGMSSGGYCALNLGLRHQAEFSVILAHEPFGTPGRSALRLLGGSPARYRANSPIATIPGMPFRRRLAVFLDAPADDPASLADTTCMAQELAARHQFVTLQIADGVGHTWREARLELPTSLVFASEHLVAAGAGRGRQRASASPPQL